jgi:hypothetical protein
VDRFFVAQIEAAKQLQRELHARWHRERRGKFTGITDLATTIRPGIDRVTADMLTALRQLPTIAVSLPPASSMAGISPAAVRTARAPLSAPGT